MNRHFEKIRVNLISYFLLAPLLFLAAGYPQCQAQPAMPPGHPDISAMMGNASGQPSVCPAGSGAQTTQSSPGLTWTTPAGWTAVPPAAMRVASFKVAGAEGQTADVSVVPLPGMAGGDMPNVNRWRGQVGLQRATVDVLRNSAQKVEAGGQPAKLYDIGGMSSRILGVIQHRDGTAWFYKMTGDPNLVEQQKPAFIAFLQSLDFPAANAQTALPPERPAFDSTAAAAPVSHEGQPAWQVPSGWQEISGGQFLIAKFLIPGEAGLRAVVNVSRANGDGGGLAANVNRWRGQLGLPAVQAIATTPVSVNQGSAMLVDLTGASPESGKPARVIGVVVNQSGQTWFYKLMGDQTLVASQRDAFLHFVGGVNY